MAYENDKKSKRLSLIERAAGKLEPDVTIREPSHHSVNAPREERPSFALRRPAASEQRPVVAIDVARLHAKGIASPANSRSMTAEELRHVKRSVLSEARAGTNDGLGSNLVMVTSALPSEGKTFVSIALAMSLALERDHSVLLVDGDMTRPRLDKELGFKASRGLVDLLLNPSLQVSDVLLRTDIANFTLLPAGEPHALNTELVASKRMESLVTELSHRYADRIVIFDSPPVLVTNQALALAQYMGQILLVVAAERTLRSCVEAAVEQLRSVGSLKLVLNQVHRRFLAPYVDGQSN